MNMNRSTTAYRRAQCLIFVVFKGPIGTLADVTLKRSPLIRSDYETYALMPLALRANPKVDAWISANNIIVISSDQECTSLQPALTDGKVEVVELILSVQTEFDNPGPQKVGCSFFYKDVIEQLFPVDTYLYPIHNDAVCDVVCAIDDQNTDFLRSILSFGPDIKILHPHGGTLLHLAANRGPETMVKVFLECGANIEAGKHNRSTPLHAAIYGEHPKIVELLLMSGANVDAEAIGLQENETPLYFAAEVANRTEPCGRLRSANFFQDGYMPSLVNLAPELVEIILRHNPSLENSSNKKAFLYALSRRGGQNKAVAQKMVQYGFTVTNPEANNPILFLGAIRHNLFELVRKFYREGIDINLLTASFDQTPLHVAAGYADLDVLNFIVDQGADLSARDSKGATPLIEAAEMRNWANVERLVNLGARVNDADVDGRNALYVACAQGSRENVALLLKNGADINSNCTVGQTPIFAAVRRGELSVVETLLNCGARFDVQDEHRNTVLQIAFRETCPQLFKMLLEHGFLDVDCLIETEIYRVFGRASARNGNIAWCSYESQSRAARSLGQRGQILVRHISMANAASSSASQIILGPSRNQNDETVIAFLSECQHEISRMKNDKIVDDNDATFYDILTNDVLWVSRLLRRRAVREAFDSGNYRSEYPIYASALRCRLKKGHLRNELMEEVVGSPRSLFREFSSLPRELKEIIIKDLSILELMIFKNVCLRAE